MKIKITIGICVAIIIHFVLVFNVPSYRQAIRDIGHSSGAILVTDIHQKKYLTEIFESIPELHGKTNVSFGENSALIVDIDVELSDVGSFKESMKEVYSYLDTQFGDDSMPLIIRTKTHSFNLPE